MGARNFKTSETKSVLSEAMQTNMTWLHSNLT